MKEFLNQLAWMFGGICLVAVIIEFPYSIYQNTEFALSARSLGIYLFISTFFAIYKVTSSKRTKLNQSEGPF
jgi:cell division protein FtsW (lipid II flippase)